LKRGSVLLSPEEVMTKRLLRLLRILPLALLFGGLASAQTTGTIIGVVTDASTGKPIAGALVVATSPAQQGEQTAVTDPAGNYRVTLLPPGEYKVAVQVEGYKPFERSDVLVRIDKTVRANLSVVPEAVQLEEQVVKTGVAPVIDVGSAEAGQIVSNEFMSSIPVGRGYEAASIVTPTAKFDTYGIGFAGAQSPENQYLVDGMNTTDPTFGTRTTLNGPPALRTNFVQQLDVKTGGYSAEYGRATGAILSNVLKSGSNEFGGSVFTSWTPSFLVEPDGRAITSAGESIAYHTKPSEGSYQLDYGFEVGGPIMKDRLWFYVGFAPILQKTAYERYLNVNTMPSAQTGQCPAGSTPDGTAGPGGQCVDADGNYLQTRIAGSTSIEETSRTTYQWVGKLTWLLNENNTITLSGWGAPSSRTNLSTGFIGGPMYAAESNRLVDTNDAMNSLLVKWGGKFLDKRLIAEVQAGWFSTYNTPQNKTVAGVNQGTAPKIEWTADMAMSDFETAAGSCSLAQCPVLGYSTGGRGGIFEWTTNRYNAKGTLAYLFEAGGSHNVMGGVDLERLDYDVTQQYSGDSYFRYRTDLIGVVGNRPVFQAFRGYGNIENPTISASGVWGTNISTDVTQGPGKNTSVTNSFAYFLQDQYEPIRGLTFDLGVRLEQQNMYNKNFPDNPGFDINNEWQPRLAAIWDFTGTGRGKLGANWGRFYYAMPLDMGNRAFGSEVSLSYYVYADTCGNFSQVPAGQFDTNQVNFNNCQVVPRGSPGAFRLTGTGIGTPADPNLHGQYVDQWGAQAEYEVLPDMSVGVEYQARRQGYVIEHRSSNDGGDYFIGNPGVDRNIYYPASAPIVGGDLAGNSKYVTTVDPQTGREVSITFPKPKRSYDGVTLRLQKNFSQNWLAQASYTVSYLRGNYAGPFRPEDGQLDPGITSEYDLASLMANKNGYLPGDQTHQIKLYGAYNWNLSERFNLQASGAYTGYSGVPVNALGAHPDYGTSQAFIIPRGMAGRSPFTNTVDLGGQLGYVVKAPYAVNFRVDLFNVFNSQTIQIIDEDYTYDSVVPINGIDCKNRDAVSQTNKISALQADCPDITYLKTVDGRPITPNPNWGKAAKTSIAYQAPFSMRLTLSLTF
jgi:hypothetical protein